MATEAERERALEAIRSLIPPGAKLIRQRNSDMYWAANSQGHVGANPFSAALYLPGSRADEFPDFGQEPQWYSPAGTMDPMMAIRECADWFGSGSIVEAMGLEIVRLRADVEIWRGLHDAAVADAGEVGDE